MIDGHVDFITETMIAGWAADLNQPHIPVKLEIVLEGCVIGVARPGNKRPDVCRSINVEGDFGFEFDLSGFDVAGKSIQVRYAENLHLVRNGEKVLPGRNDVVRAGDDWIFGGTTSHGSALEIVTGTKLFQSTDIDQVGQEWTRRSNLLSSLCSSETFIVPDKSVVYAKHLPNDLTISEERPVSRLIRNKKNVNYLLLTLKNLSQAVEIYHKNDTHMNDLGVLISFSAICSFLEGRFGLKFNTEFHIEPVDYEHFGDLGTHVDGTLVKEAKKLTFPRSITSVSANGKINIGSVRRYTNSANCSAPRVVLLGTSTALQHARLFAESCRELLFVFNNSFPIEAIRQFRPDIVITILTERFIMDTEFGIDADDLILPGDHSNAEPQNF